MCGIVSIFNIQEQTPELRLKALNMSRKIRHRGPDWSGIYCGGSAIMCHERLSIVDPESGKQPLFSPDKKQVLAVNGEIYNHLNIRMFFGLTLTALVFFAVWVNTFVSFDFLTLLLSPIVTGKQIGRAHV